MYSSAITTLWCHDWRAVDRQERSEGDHKRIKQEKSCVLIKLEILLESVMTGKSLCPWSSDCILLFIKLESQYTKLLVKSFVRLFEESGVAARGTTLFYLQHANISESIFMNYYCKIRLDSSKTRQVREISNEPLYFFFMFEFSFDFL